MPVLSEKNQTFRERIFGEKCSKCEMYTERHKIASAINNLYTDYDSFWLETTGATGEWDFDRCFSACIWKEIQEINRLVNVTKKNYHRKNPKAKCFTEKVKEVKL